MSAAAASLVQRHVFLHSRCFLQREQDSPPPPAIRLVQNQAEGPEVTKELRSFTLADVSVRRVSDPPARDKQDLKCSLAAASDEANHRSDSRSLLIP